MSESRRCPQCGAEFPAGGSDAPCPACLIKLGLESWADRAGGEPGKDDAAADAIPGRFQPPDPEELAEYFPQLEILEVLGVGGMGVVYKARQPGLDRLVALKILPPKVGRDPAFAERFAREARALAKLSHPNIVAIHDAGQAGEFYYLVMEFVEGVNLRQASLTAQFGPQEALAVVPQICEALQFAHDEGIVHRDVKPENILLDKQGRVKIADFGLAKLMGKAPAEFKLTGTGQVMGTVHYMAPEQTERPAEIDHRADIYSLGVVFYEMLTGELPIGRFAPPSKKAQVDVRIDEVVLRALENDPERRYQHVSQIKTDVESIGGHSEPPAAATADEIHRDFSEKAAKRHPDPSNPPPPPPIASGGGPSHKRSRQPGQRRRSAGLEFFKVVLGGLAAIPLAGLILWYGFGRDPFGVWDGSADGVASRVIDPESQAPVTGAVSKADPQELKPPIPPRPKSPPEIAAEKDPKPLNDEPKIAPRESDSPQSTPEKLESGGMGPIEIVVWNTHNWGYGGRGTLEFDIAILANQKVLWEQTKIGIDWREDGPSSVRIPVPATVKRIDKLRLTITKGYWMSAGLAEIEVIRGGCNIAKGCSVVTDGKYPENKVKPSNLTDGITEDAGDGKGYWLHDKLTGWVEIDLTAGESEQSEVTAQAVLQMTPAVVRVTDEGVFQKLEPKARLWGNRDDRYWVEIPPELEDSLLFQHADCHHGVLHFEVVKSGVVLIAANWSKLRSTDGKEHVSLAEFETEGWRPIATLPAFSAASQSHFSWTVFAKQCKAGEYAYQTSKYAAPILIVPQRPAETRSDPQIPDQPTSKPLELKPKAGREPKPSEGTEPSRSKMAPAVVRVTTAGMYQALRPNAEVFGNRSQKYWLGIPPELQGRLFFQSADAHQGITQFTVLKSGVVLIATTNRWLEKGGVYGKEHFSREQFEKDGWRQVATLRSFQTVKESLSWTVYAKQCESGEAFAYQTEKYIAPVLIVAQQRQ